MKIFGINFTTKKELTHRISVLEVDLDACEEELEEVLEAFPLGIGQTVYDVALKNDKGRYTKLRPSLEYSTITPVEVTEKNYFSLVKRFRRNDVFFKQEEAEEYLKSICK